MNIFGMRSTCYEGGKEEKRRENRVQFRMGAALASYNVMKWLWNVTNLI